MAADFVARKDKYEGSVDLEAFYALYGLSPEQILQGILTGHQYQRFLSLTNQGKVVKLIRSSFRE